MSLLKSQKMKYCHVVSSKEYLWEALNKLGNFASIHFINPDPTMAVTALPYLSAIKTCEEVLMKIYNIEKTMKTFREDNMYHQLKIQRVEDEKELINKFEFYLKDRAQKQGKHDGSQFLFEIYDEVIQASKNLDDQTKHYEELLMRNNELVEEQGILEGTAPIFFKNEAGQYGDLQLQQHGMQAYAGVNHIIGTIDSRDEERFHRMIFRVSKGNSHVSIFDHQFHSALKDPSTQEIITKKIFVILYPNGETNIVKNKVERICDVFKCTRKQFPGPINDYNERMKQIHQDLRDNEDVIRYTKDGLLEFYKSWISNQDRMCSKIEEFRLYTVKEKGIYYIMNYFSNENSGLYMQAYAWIPKAELDTIQRELQQLPNYNSSQFQITPEKKPDPEKFKPPSYFKTNDFTDCFQLITNTYGVPRYKEINPSYFNLMTFPFLFGVMFGDMAHGSILTMFGAFLVIFDKSLKKSAFAAFSQVRYFVLFMGIFAIYCGLIYNDFTSLSFDFFGSCYDATKTFECPEDYHQECYPYNTDRNKGDENDTILQTCTYPFGLDPVWSIAQNNITYVNSFKMKLAVIFGVLQMCVGICLKGWNSIIFKSPLDFIFEFIPQILFMVCTFGYMDFLIIYKWTKNYQVDNSYAAPSIITLMINLPLKMGDPGDYALYGNVDGSTQKNIQMILLVIALLMVPMMLIPKPIILYCTRKPRVIQQQPNLHERLIEDEDQRGSDYMSAKSQQQDHDEEEHGFGEIFIHQVIETIEFVLGSISNTASYLRLWALSLAHGQLAEVFFQKGMESSIESQSRGGFIGLILGFYVFALITFGVLMCMDVMECFLHALRLHWVEFQNKFYKGDGIDFSPFSFQTLLKDNQRDDDDEDA